MFLFTCLDPLLRTHADLASEKKEVILQNAAAYATFQDGAITIESSEHKTPCTIKSTWHLHKNTLG